MKLMDRYIVREMVVPFVAGSLVIALLFAGNQLIFILKTYHPQNVPISAMVQMVFYRMPFWLNMTLPAGISLAASLAISRLSRESEITAMRACGVRVVRVILPVAIFGLVVSVGNFYLVEKVMPITQARANKLDIDVGIVNATPTFQSNVWITLGNERYHATFAEVRRRNDDSLVIKDVWLGDRHSSGTVAFLHAPTGTYRNGVWTFQDVSLWDLTGDKFRITPIHGNSMTIYQPIFVNDVFSQAQMPTDKTLKELAAAITAGKAVGRDMTREEVSYHERFATPAACIVFAIVAPIFAVYFARTGSFMGVMLSFVLVLLYYNAFVISTDIFGPNHWVSPWLAAWLPNFVFAGLGLLGLRRLE